MNRRIKNWHALMTPEGRPLQVGRMSRTYAKKLNKFYRDSEAGYRWVLASAYIHQIYIGELTT